MVQYFLASPAVSRASSARPVRGRANVNRKRRAAPRGSARCAALGAWGRTGPGREDSTSVRGPHVGSQGVTAMVGVPREELIGQGRGQARPRPRASTRAALGSPARSASRCSSTPSSRFRAGGDPAVNQSEWAEVEAKSVELLRESKDLDSTYWTIAQIRLNGLCGLTAGPRLVSHLCDVLARPAPRRAAGDAVGVQRINWINELAQARVLRACATRSSTSTAGRTGRPVTPASLDLQKQNLELSQQKTDYWLFPQTKVGGPRRPATLRPTGACSKSRMVNRIILDAAAGLETAGDGVDAGQGRAARRADRPRRPSSRPCVARKVTSFPSRR